MSYRPRLTGLLLSLVALLGTAAAKPKPELGIYIVAHTDDWPLFMGDRVVSDLRARKHVAIIQAIAESPSPCWEQASVAAMVMAANPAAPKPPICNSANDYGVAKCTHVMINGHSVQTCAYKSATAYFLKLPESLCPECVKAEHEAEDGFLRDGRTLKRLHKGLIQDLMAIDKSATYSSFEDVVQTIRSIAERHSKASAAVTIHSLDPSVTANPTDHVDHTATGCAAATAFAKGQAPQRYYVGYGSENQPPNIPAEAAAMKQALFAEFARVSGEPDRFRGARYTEWTKRTIYREVRAAQSAQIAGSIVFYDATAGTGTVMDVATQCTRKYFGWRPTWSMAVTARLLGDDDQFLLYSQRDGAGAIVSLGKKYSECVFNQWSYQSWSTISPVDFSLATASALLFYDKTAGAAHVRRIAACPVDVPVAGPYYDWRHTWLSIVSGSFFGTEKSDVLLYDPTASQMSVQYLPTSGGTPIDRGDFAIKRGAWQFVGGQFREDSHTDVFGLDTNSGQAEFLVSDGNGGFSIKSLSTGGLADVRLVLAVPLAGQNTGIATLKTDDTFDIWAVSKDLELSRLGTFMSPGRWTLAATVDSRR